MPGFDRALSLSKGCHRLPRACRASTSSLTESPVGCPPTAPCLSGFDKLSQQGSDRRSRALHALAEHPAGGTLYE